MYENYSVRNNLSVQIKSINNFDQYKYIKRKMYVLYISFEIYLKYSNEITETCKIKEKILNISYVM